MQGVSDLPDDIEILKQIVIEQRANFSPTPADRAAWLSSPSFAGCSSTRSSEQIDEKIAQLELTLEDLEVRGAAVAPALPAVLPERVEPVPTAARELAARDPRSRNRLPMPRVRHRDERAR